MAIALSAAAVLLLPPSCKRTELEKGGYVPSDGLQPVTLNAGLSTSVQTKGMGPVDDWDPRQKLFVYVVARESQGREFNQFNLDFENPFYIDNAPLNTPEAGNPGAAASLILYEEEGKPYYYEPDVRYEFFGYSVDDAGGAPIKEADRVYIPVTIDGTQDLLAAVTDRAADKETAGHPEVADNNMYGDYASRRNIHPGLVFKHQLARFNVYVKSGDRFDLEADPDPLVLKRVQIESFTKADFVVANRVCNRRDEFENLVSSGNGLLPETFSDSKWLNIWLPEDGDPAYVPPQEWSDESFLGSIMVMPGQSVYNCRLGFEQKGVDAPGLLSEFGDIQYDFKIDFKDLLPFAEDPKYAASDGDDTALDQVAVAGHQYDVNVIVYSLREVFISVSLTPWSTGGSFLVDDDPGQRYDNLDVVCDDIQVVVGETAPVNRKIVKTNLKTGEVTDATPADYRGVEFSYELSNDLVSLDEENLTVTAGDTDGLTWMRIRAVKYRLNDDGTIYYTPAGNKRVIAKGETVVKIDVQKYAPKDPDFVVYSKGVPLEEDDVVEWNIAHSGSIVKFVATHSGGGEITSEISRQQRKTLAWDDGVGEYVWQNAEWLDVLTRKPLGNLDFEVVADIPEGSPDKYTAVIDFYIAPDPEKGYKASAVKINVEVINVP